MSSSGAGSSNVLCPNKIAKLSLVKFTANNIDLSFSYHQFEKQKPHGVINSEFFPLTVLYSLLSLNDKHFTIIVYLFPQSGGCNVVDNALPGEYTQTAFKASVDGVYGQLHILHPLIGYAVNLNNQVFISSK